MQPEELTEDKKKIAKTCKVQRSQSFRQFSCATNVYWYALLHKNINIY